VDKLMPDPSTAFFAGLRSQPAGGAAPPFADGWGADRDPFLFYYDVAGSAWSDDLEEIHEESSREHFLDVWTRQSLLAAIARTVPADGVVADLGCSTGYLLEDLDRAHPEAQLVGVDVVAAGLRKAHFAVPRAALLLADVGDLPIGDASVDAVVSANMLEHVADDGQALREIKRILRPGAVAALIVPYGRNLYDYYDRFLGHERRYGRGELAAKADRAGFELLEVGHLGQLLYAPFWLVKKRNRVLRGKLEGDALRERVERDIAGTSNSALGEFAARTEKWLTRHRAHVRVGIRELVVLRRPAN
jgi:SAM-dependent methyltransferase